MDCGVKDGEENLLMLENRREEGIRISLFENLKDEKILDSKNKLEDNIPFHRNKT
jgi:hypothetical protein